MPLVPWNGEGVVVGVEARIGVAVAVGAAVAAIGLWMFGRAFVEVEEAGNPAPY